MILEMDTYRYHGHSMSDPGSTYRTRDEISAIRQKRDPLEHARQLLLDGGLAEVSDIKGIERDVKKQIDEALAQAKGPPQPPMEDLWANIWQAPLGAEMRGIDSSHKQRLPE
ncbi:hypothetical protein ABPG77_001899 [Micractinium sp. CCAP 211/92]